MKTRQPKQSNSNKSRLRTLTTSKLAAVHGGIDGGQPLTQPTSPISSPITSPISVKPPQGWQNHSESMARDNQRKPRRA
jgi:hypothetical protein